MPERFPLRGTWAGLAVLSTAGITAYLAAVRPWHRRWGATDDEVKRSMPGDDLVRNANFETTRAVVIVAPPDAVWPWLVQIGQGRGGFYSYDFLENMMGLDIQSAARVHPEFQHLQVGDTIPFDPEGGGYTVAELEPGHRLVLFTEGTGTSETDEVFRRANAASTWTFLLKRLEGDRTRLVVRWRARWDLLSSPGSLFIGLMLGPVEFLMEQKMMRGIRDRAEAATPVAD